MEAQIGDDYSWTFLGYFVRVFEASYSQQGKPGMRWMDNMEEWAGMTFEDLLKKTRNRRKWSSLVHEATNHRIDDGWRLSQQLNIRRIIRSWMCWTRPTLL